MSKIIVLASDKTEAQLRGACETSSVSWSRLAEHLEPAIGLRANERIVGLEITDSGVKVLIDFR